MKVWMFYLNDRKLYEKFRNMNMISVDYDNTGKKPLYAYTNDKKLAKGFKQTRNMSQFKEKVLHVDEEELKEIDDHFYFSSKLLVGEVTYGEDKVVHIILTTSEHFVIVENARETIGCLGESLELPALALFVPRVQTLLTAIKYQEYKEASKSKIPYLGYKELMEAYTEKYKRFTKIVNRGYGGNQFGLLLYLCGDIFDEAKLCEVIQYENG